MDAFLNVHSMPSTFQNPGETYTRIIAAAVAKLIKDPQPFSKVVVVDCRSDFEYSAGHIKGAISVNNDSKMMDLIQSYDPNACYIFHCEWSQVRGPAACRTFSNRLKEQGNKDPHCYVLDRGFRSFFKTHSSFCIGQYQPQND